MIRCAASSGVVRRTQPVTINDCDTKSAALSEGGGYKMTELLAI
jgi:hypothetical protein